MIKTSTEYISDRLFFEAVDLEVDMILNERTYETLEGYLQDIYNVWIEVKAYAYIHDETLDRVDTQEDVTGNAMMSIILNFLEVKLQS